MLETFAPDPGLPRPDRELCDQLTGLAHGESVNEVTMQEAIRGYTRTLRSAGALPEKTIVAVKAAAANAGLLPYSDERDRVSVERIVKWCIAEYYRAD